MLGLEKEMLDCDNHHAKEVAQALSKRATNSFVPVPGLSSVQPSRLRKPGGLWYIAERI